MILKVEPRFKLDQTFRGPYHVESVTSSNVVIRPVNDPTAERWNVSIQRVSNCNPSLSSSSPWFGHGKKRNRRRRHQIVRPREPQSDDGEITESYQTLSPDTANPYDCLLDIRTMLHHKVQVEEVA